MDFLCKICQPEPAVQLESLDDVVSYLHTVINTIASKYKATWVKYMLTFNKLAICCENGAGHLVLCRRIQYDGCITDYCGEQVLEDQHLAPLLPWHTMTNDELARARDNQSRKLEEVGNILVVGCDFPLELKVQDTPLIPLSHAKFRQADEDFINCIGKKLSSQLKDHDAVYWDYFQKRIRFWSRNELKHSMGSIFELEPDTLSCVQKSRSLPADMKGMLYRISQQQIRQKHLKLKVLSNLILNHRQMQMWLWHQS